MKWLSDLLAILFRRAPPDRAEPPRPVVFPQAVPRMSTQGREMLKRFEGFKVSPYRDAVGLLTWGYGHCGKPGETPPPFITRAQADDLLTEDLREFEAGVARLVMVPLVQHEYDALVSFAYNLGLDEDDDLEPEGLGDSGLLRRLNAGDRRGAAAQFDLWIYAGGRVLGGLVRRRAQERACFERGDYGEGA